MIYIESINNVVNTVLSLFAQNVHDIIEKEKKS